MWMRIQRKLVNLGQCAIIRTATQIDGSIAVVAVDADGDEHVITEFLTDDEAQNYMDGLKDRLNDQRRR